MADCFFKICLQTTPKCQKKSVAGTAIIGKRLWLTIKLVKRGPKMIDIH